VAKKEGNGKTKMAVMAVDISYIKDEMKEIKELLMKNYITRQEFEPVKKIVYGMVVLILAAVGTAIVSLVLRGRV